VLTTERLSPSMIRLVFGGPGLTDYVSIGHPDEAVALYFPREGESRPPEMTLVDGHWWYHDIENPPEGRNYTVRALEPGRMTIDFVAHEGGLAATWALQAAPGQELVMARPRCWYDVPGDTDWQLLLSDLTGLPAVGRIVEELPAGARVHVAVEVLSADDQQTFETQGNVTYDWRIGGNGYKPSVLADAATKFERPDGQGYVWFAGEAATSRAIRTWVRKELGYDSKRFAIIGYWRANGEEWARKFEKHKEEALAVYYAAVEEGKNELEAGELYDRKLESLGL
jgi:NADPH-dependent ferric siderophore reductase